MSCGADNEGAPGEPGTPANSNAYFSYGAMTARNIDADYMCISWSGKTMDAEHGMPAIYERIVPEYYSKWNYSTWIPDIVVINLSTNDLARKMMKDEAAWIGGYEKFVSRLRGYYPRAQIYCLTSPMLRNIHHAISKKCIGKVVDDLMAAGDKNIHLVDLDEMDPATGVGAAGHPNIRTHERMAEKLTAAIRADF